MAKGMARLMVELSREVGAAAKSYVDVAESTNEVWRRRHLADLARELHHVVRAAEAALDLIETADPDVSL